MNVNQPIELPDDEALVFNAVPKVHVVQRPLPPSESWWIGLSRPAFVAAIDRELPRMQGSRMARVVYGQKVLQ